MRRSLGAVICVATLWTVPAQAGTAALPFSDSFNATAINPVWTVESRRGSVAAVSNQAHFTMKRRPSFARLVLDGVSVANITAQVDYVLIDLPAGKSGAFEIALRQVGGKAAVILQRRSRHKLNPRQSYRLLEVNANGREREVLALPTTDTAGTLKLQRLNGVVTAFVNNVAFGTASLPGGGVQPYIGGRGGIARSTTVAADNFSAS